METEFLSMTDKAVLLSKISIGGQDAAKTLINEIQRLESVIKDYELGVKLLNDKFNNKTFKKP